MEQFTNLGIAGAILAVLFWVIKENVAYLKERNSALDFTLVKVVEKLDVIDERQAATTELMYQISANQVKLNEKLGTPAYATPIPKGVRRAAAQVPDITDEELREGIGVRGAQ